MNSAESSTEKKAEAGDPKGPRPKRKAWKLEEEVPEVREVSPRRGAARSAPPTSVGAVLGGGAVGRDGGGQAELG